jgi:pimeloyl-ACP methyl ester carboxylesterase
MAHLLDRLRHIILPPTPTPERASLVGVSVVSTAILIKIARYLLFAPPKSLVIPGPTTTLLPKLTQEERSALPYPPDTLPGGRDVKSPYGTIRAYEWGPEDGRKVLLVHGITTPCIALGGVAQGLVENGCRVLLFDLWGRGYTDTPADMKHDDRLYAMQILTVLASSPLSWMGSDSADHPHPGFDLVGYSLGGGIATAFASWFSHLIRSLVLLAPAGIIRKHHMSARDKVIAATGLVPEPLLLWLSKRRLMAGPISAKENKRLDELDQVDAETISKFRPLSQRRPDVTVIQAVQWQLRNHDGFVHSFLSSIRFASITGKEENWHRLKDARGDKVCLIAGRDDPIILAQEVREDAEALLGADRVHYYEVHSTHDFPVTEADEVVDDILDFWNIHGAAATSTAL